MSQPGQPEVSAPSTAEHARNGAAPLRLLIEDHQTHWFDAPHGLADIGPAPANTPALRLLVEDFDPAARHREIFPAGSPDLPPAAAGAPDFLVDWRNKAADSQRLSTRAASYGAHLALIVFLLLQPYIPHENEFTKPEPDSDTTDITLLAPSRELIAELTRDPDHQGETKVFRGESEQPRPAVVTPNPTVSQPTPPRIEPPQPVIPDKPEPAPAPQMVEEAPKPKPEPEPPQVAASQTPAPGDLQRGRRLARTGRIQEIPIPEPVQKAEKPKLVLEDPLARMESEKGPIELAKLGIGSRPDQLVENAVQTMQEHGGGPQAVGDGVGSAGGGYVPPSPGNIGSGLELLSDPKGVDFRPYLLQLLNAVRRNWYAVLPESARLGMERGRVAVQFSVDRQGNVPKLVIASSSSSQPLDRAAVAGVSASLPFPPLPREYTGQEIRLQFVFLYNMR
ncbi:MAG: TonB family protein [Bryobacterales bacterium]|nr:TonB family protein [Bryobacterales bacterium]